MASYGQVVHAATKIRSLGQSQGGVNGEKAIAKAFAQLAYCHLADHGQKIPAVSARNSCITVATMNGLPMLRLNAILSQSPVRPQENNAEARFAAQLPGKQLSAGCVPCRVASHIPPMYRSVLLNVRSS
eukprot:scaffold30707_cov25-Tisochrysis_lutea.AAC.2